MLGAGFKIAMRDLEIRSAGNLLGAEQSDRIATVGYEMYCQLLEQSVADLRKDVVISGTDTTIEIGARGSIPRGYIPSDNRRMEAYRRIGQVSRSNRSNGRDMISGAYDAPRGGLRASRTRRGPPGGLRHRVRAIVIRERTWSSERSSRACWSS